MIRLTVAEGVHRVEDAYVNWYAVEESTCLIGHGEPWRGSVAEAVTPGRAAGPS